MGKHLLIVIFFLMVSIGSGCSHNSGPLTTPEPQKQNDVAYQSENGAHHLWYYTLLSFDPATMKLEVIRMRDVEAHWNVLTYLENGPCTNCVSIQGVQKLINNNLEISVQIKHPFASYNFTGFDVRGIAMFKGTQNFPATGLKASSLLKGDAELVNPDGYSSLYNPTTGGSGPDGLQGYLQGKLASGVPDSTVNGYKYFITDAPGNTRNYFLGGGTITSKFEIHMPSGPFLMGYAVDASWVDATVKPVTDPITDFPGNANCAEPWKVIVSEDPLNNNLTDLGGNTTISIAVYDHQGKDSHKAPYVECPGLFDGTVAATFVQDEAGYSLWTATITNSNSAPAGKYRVLVGVEDYNNDTAPPYLDLTAYQITTVLVTPDSALHGWGISFGGMNVDGIRDTVTDPSGNIYVTGFFTGTADFDPGSGVANLTANGLQDVFLAKYDKSGNYQWAVNWGGETNEGYSILLRNTTLYVYGFFKDGAYGAIDFDPGSGEDLHSSVGIQDLFISAFDTTGDHKWTVTWGSAGDDYAGGMDMDATGKLYASGRYAGTTDFDPGPGDLQRTCTGGTDCFLMKLDGLANYIWVKTWGGIDNDLVNYISTSPGGQTWVAGNFRNTVDFNPDAGVSNITSNGSFDVFVSRFDANGNFKWAKAWGGSDADDARSMVIDYLGYSWITGSFKETVDFDPSTGSAPHTSDGFTDAYLLELDPNGNYVWSGRIGGTGWDYGEAIAMDSIGNIYLGGDFFETVDLDPGPGQQYYTANGNVDAFLIKLSPTTEFLWGDAWGGGNRDLVLGIYVDDYAKAYVGGLFYNSADFDPGPGEDIHDGTGSDAFLNVIPRTGSW